MLLSKSQTTFVVVWIAAFAVSLIAIQGPFLSDEYEFLYAAARVHSLADLWIMLFSKIGGDFFRPILHLSFLIDYRIYGLAPWGYHLTNSLIYATTAALISAIVWQAGVMYLRTSRFVGELRFLALSSGIVFALLPNHHETVTWLAGRTDLLATMWYAATLYAYLLYLHRYCSTAVTDNRIRQLMQGFCIALLSILAYGTKEMSITLVVVVAALSMVHVWHNRGRILKRNMVHIAVLWCFSLAMCIGYVLVRHSILGFWFGGYVAGGRSVFLDIDLHSITRWLLSPLLYLIYSINYSYAFAFVSTLVRLPVSLAEYSKFVFAIECAVYTGAALTAIAFVWLSVRRRTIRKTVATVVLFALLFYITVIPVIAVLWTLSRSLESTRFLYLPSIAIACGFAYWLSLWQRRARAIVMTLMCVVLLSLYVFNHRPWVLAGRSAKSIRDAIVSHRSEIRSDDWLYVINVPDNLYGAYVFRRGLPHMVWLLKQGVIDTSRIIMSGRGVEGTHAPGCINVLSNTYWIMDLDDAAGTVRSFSRANSTSERPSVTIKLGSGDMEFNDITTESSGRYRVIGSNPYITFKNINADPATILEATIRIRPEHAYTEKQWDVFWTTDRKPLYHMFHRHFWVIRDSGIDPATDLITIPLCTYPAFLFSDTIRDMRIRLPYEKGEQFKLEV
ncbi:MAG: hypothetical protein AAB490_05780 [Patescibacteria group bacterium]